MTEQERPEPIFKEDRVCNKNVSSQKASDPGVRPCIFDEIIQQMSDIHRRKNADYGDAAYKGYKEFGITYYIIQLHNKLSRLKSLTENNGKPQVNESIEDTLLDMANYAVLALEALKRDGQ
jgi:predicted DNA-binding protein